MREMGMIQLKEKRGLLYIITLEGHLKYMFGHCNNVNANMVLSVFYNALSTAVVMLNQ
jgi:hypothetical protein